MKQIEIIEADLDNEEQAADVLRLTDMYARDAMGMDQPLPTATHVNLIKKMREFSNVFTLLAYINEEAVGLANCFIGFSTFDARNLINIHDLAVVPEWRGIGIGKRLLEAVELKAREMNCTKITLEVREDNPARELYERIGFENEEPKMWFMTKELY